MQINRKSAFTLVELIVVITILAILGTIAFISLQGYSRDARDGTRISDIKSTETGLELFAIKVGKYPVPDNVVSYTGGSAVINQGILGKQVTRNTKLSKIILDPVTKENYVYSTFGKGKYYQLAADLEGSLTYIPSPGRGGLGRGIISQANAATPTSSLVRGNYTFDPILPSLILVPSSVTSSGIFDKNVCFVLNGGKNTLNNCVEKKSQMDMASLDSNLVAYWDMETLCNGGNCGVGNDGMVKNLATNDLNTLSGTALKTHSGANFMTQTFTGSAIFGNGSANVTSWDNGLETNGIIDVIKKELTVSMIFSPNESSYVNHIIPYYRNFLFDYQNIGKYRMTSVLRSDINGTYINAHKSFDGKLINTLKQAGINYLKGKKYLITLVYKNGVVGSKNSEISLYINGRLNNTNNAEAYLNYNYSGTLFNIGTSSTFDACGRADIPDYLHLPKGCPLNGVIDEVRIYDKALTASQISQQNFIVK